MSFVIGLSVGILVGANVALIVTALFSINRQDKKVK